MKQSAEEVQSNIGIWNFQMFKYLLKKNETKWIYVNFMSIFIFNFILKL